MALNISGTALTEAGFLEIIVFFAKTRDLEPIHCNSEYLASGEKLQQLPELSWPEYAFLGRSNVGKSTLINALTNTRDLARTSNRPGRTRMLNLFKIEMKRVEESKILAFCDMPGYGFARVSKAQRKEWEDRSREYLLNRPHFCGLFLLLDARLKLQELDRKTIHWCGQNQVPLALVLTKSDLLSRNARMAIRSGIEAELQNEWATLPPIFAVSSQKKFGIPELRTYIFDQTQYPAS